MNKQKIFIINNGLSGGGTERASVSLANHFEELGYKVFVLALYKSKHFFKLNNDIIFYEPDFDRDNLNRYLYVLKMILFVRKQIKLIKPDTILAFNEWTNPFIVIATRGLGIPLYLSDRMNPLAKLPFLSEKLKQFFYKKADGIIAQTGFAKGIIQKNTGASNIVVIHNPVNVIEKVNCEQKKRIVTVGRLANVKGHKILIEAFAKVIDKSWELSIVGDGDERFNLENLAVKLKIRNRVFFHGHLHDFSLQLSEAQIFVLPSFKEGFPNALIEAMSVPLACISSDFFVGQNEIINAGINGILFEPGNIDELANALNRLISDEKLRNKISENAFKVREELEFKKIAQKYLKFILNINA